MATQQQIAAAKAVRLAVHQLNVELRAAGELGIVIELSEIGRVGRHNPEYVVTTCETREPIDAS